MSIVIIELLEELGAIDGLTEIPNRRYFDEALEREHARAVRNNEEVSLILMDIDYFKRFNDNYGHAAGDECLKKVALTIAGSLMRPADISARYGGEKFAVILPDTSLKGAEDMAEKIITKIRELGIPHGYSDAEKCVTISLGVVSKIPAAGELPVDMIKEADSALYRAKESGRNQFKQYFTETQK